MQSQVELINGWIPGGDWVWPLVLAPFIGSFAGVLILRIPAGLPIARARSACPGCAHALGVLDLVPLVSFLALRGNCRFCGGRIARFHFYVELAAVAVAGCAIAAGERGGLLWAGCALGWILLTLAWIDSVALQLPDLLTLPLILLGLGEASWLEPDALTDRALGAAVGYTGFRVLELAYRRFRGRDGLGQGDAKLLAAGGAWVGAWLLPDVLLAAALAGLVYAFRRFSVDPLERIPFGPFLAAGIWLVWLVF